MKEDYVFLRSADHRKYAVIKWLRQGEWLCFQMNSFIRISSKSIDLIDATFSIWRRTFFFDKLYSDGLFEFRPDLMMREFLLERFSVELIKIQTSLLHLPTSA